MLNKIIKSVKSFTKRAILAIGKYGTTLQNTAIIVGCVGLFKSVVEKTEGVAVVDMNVIVAVASVGIVTSALINKCQQVYQAYLIEEALDITQQLNIRVMELEIQMYLPE